MESVQEPSISQLAFGDLPNELDMTRRVLERVPEEKFDWKPHQKSYSLGQLSFHVANLVNWQRMILHDDGFDLATSPPPEEGPLPSREELLKTFDDNRAALTETVETFDVKKLGEPWTLKHGDHEVFTSPKAEVFRSAGISHMVHHRAQLTVYLRLLDVPVPGTYGPSADDQM
jgi:uncharacterized damage-inducible protein DinB